MTAHVDASGRLHLLLGEIGDRLVALIDVCDLVAHGAIEAEAESARFAEQLARGLREILERRDTLASCLVEVTSDPPEPVLSLNDLLPVSTTTATVGGEAVR